MACYSPFLLTAQAEHPCILERFNEFLKLVSGKRVAVFLDYDGKFVGKWECLRSLQQLGCTFYAS